MCDIFLSLSTHIQHHSHSLTTPLLLLKVCGFLFRHEEKRAKKWIERERERERSKGRYDGSTSQDPSFPLFVPVSVPLGSMEHVLPLLEL